jgi:phosphatidate cytidylyltransferase
VFVALIKPALAATLSLDAVFVWGNRTMFNTIRQRALSGIPLAALVLASLLYLPALLLLIVLAAVCALTLAEFYRLMAQAGLPCFRTTGIVIGVIPSLWAGVVLFFGTEVFWAWVVAPTLLVVAVLLRMLANRQPNAPLAAAVTCFGLAYVAVLFCFLPLLMVAWGSPAPLAPLNADSFWLIFYLVLVVKMTDNGAYAVGSLLGRHKMIPRISPAKTWEGFAGGLLFGMAFSVLVSVCLGGRLGPIMLPPAQAALLGLVLALAGTAGDLVESQFKRMAGVKDASGLLPGIGGLLDVLDSILLAAPVLFLYVWRASGM